MMPTAFGTLARMASHCFGEGHMGNIQIRPSPACAALRRNVVKRGGGSRTRGCRRREFMLWTILIVLVIIAVAMFIWRNMASRRA